MGIMSCLQFELAKFADCCFISASTLKVSLHSSLRAVFKDTRRRPRIFIYANVFICALNLIFFSHKHSWGIKRNTAPVYQWLFWFAFLVPGTLAVGITYAYKRRQHIVFQFWCVIETCAILWWIFLIISQMVSVALPGTCLLAVTTLIKLHGLWVMYYFSLEMKDSLNRQPQEDLETQDGSNIRYFVTPKKRTVQRRETDQTSVGSSAPASPTKDDDIEDYENQAYNSSVISVIDDDSPTGNTFGFFGSTECELHYSEIMVQNHFQNTTASYTDSPPQIPSSSKDNIIISDLMCGGSSAVNVELQR